MQSDKQPSAATSPQQVRFSGSSFSNASGISQGSPSTGFSILRNSRSPAKMETRIVFGFTPDEGARLPVQAIEAIHQLLKTLQEADKDVALLPWKFADRSSVPAIQNPEQSPIKNPVSAAKYCAYFNNRFPAEGKRWYSNLSIQHIIPFQDLLANVEDIVSTAGWFLKPCDIQSDSQTKEIGWFTYSIKEYASPGFRDVLALTVGVDKSKLAVNFKQVAKIPDLYAMVVQTVETEAQLLSKKLSALYSSKSTTWPWNIHLRFVPHQGVSETKSKVLEQLIALQKHFSQTIKPVFLQNLKVSLDTPVIRFKAPDTTDKIISLRQALMTIHVNQSPVFHGVAEAHDNRSGTRTCLFPYPSNGNDYRLGFLIPQYPITILSHFYGADNIKSLFLDHAIALEDGITLDPSNMTVITPEVAELDSCLTQDTYMQARFQFDFDPSAIETPKRPRLARRIDDNSVDTIRNLPSTPSAAGSSRGGTRTRFQQAAVNLSQVPGAAAATGEGP